MFLTRDDLQALQYSEWLAAAVAYMMELKVYTEHENLQAYNLAETLWENCGNDDTEFNRVSAKDAVDEELTNWGD